MIFDSFDTIPVFNVTTLAYVDGVVAGATSIDTATQAYLDGILGLTVNINSMVHGISPETTITTPAYVFGSYDSHCSSLCYVCGFGNSNVSTNAYVGGALSATPVSVDAYIYPLGRDTVSIPAFLNAEVFIGPDGTVGFNSMYGAVVLVDSEYNVVTTLLCDYYLSPSIESITYNLFVVNGTRYNTSGIMIMTDAIWSNRVSIQHGTDVQYLTDSYATTAVYTNIIEPDNAMPVVITVIEPAVTRLTIIPIYIVHGAYNG